MSRTVVVVSAGLSVPSSTRLLADRLADAAAAALHARDESVSVEVVELRGLAHSLADHLLTGFPDAELGAALSSVAAADGLVVVTPVFSASYSGLFKTFFDVIDRDALAGKPVLMAATAGTARHSLVLEHALRPLFAHLRALTVPTAVFAASEDFGSTADGSLQERVRRAAEELASLMGGSATPALRSVAPSAGDVLEGRAEVTPFEQLLRA